MNKAYYYFVASLPSLSFDGKAPMTVESFLGDCDYQLSEKDNAIIRELVEAEPVLCTGTPASASWAAFDNTLRNQIVYCRAKNMGKDPYQHMRGERVEDAGMEDLVQESLKMENLLDAEKLIDKKRWEYLDELEEKYFFDFANIIVYGLKLKILEKYTKVSSDRGFEVLQEYQESIIKN